ncbi:MAG: fumarate hydratase C-terminal domain-containing protein, partial [Bacteroidia bacterium]|nr:fumarate hydratase C-terminal domain-containing protein [Bacteroidia bacterium]
VGVGVGGYGANAVENAKSEVFRELNHDEMSTPQNPEIFPVKEFEEKLLNTINRLGLGPMGVGGDTTCLGVYIARSGSHTAVVPIAINHQCWANRASEAWMDGENLQYLTRHVDPKDAAKLRTELSDGFERKTGRIHELGLPVTTKRLQDLAVGDVVYITGKICTARDGAHRRMVDLVKDQREGEIPKEIMDYGAVYHCGPIVEKTSDRWRVCAAGPTTSSRFTEDGAFLVEKGVFNISVGKGTMGARAVEAMRDRGVYLKAMGGCAVSYGSMIENSEVKWLDLGLPEAVWIFDVKKFGPLVVEIDASGNCLTDSVMEKVFKNAYQLYEEEGLDPANRYVQNPTSLAGLSLEEVIAICRKV